MRILKRKSTLGQLVDAVTDSLEAPKGIKSKLPRSGKAVKASLLTAGGLAGLTAASAAFDGFGAGVRERRTVREASKVAPVFPTGTPLNASKPPERRRARTADAVRGFPENAGGWLHEVSGRPRPTTGTSGLPGGWVVPPPRAL